MISEEELQDLLKRHDLTQIRCHEDWGAAVLMEYDRLLRHAGDAVIADARCPAAAALVQSLNPEIRIADIEPILIHCARELAARTDLSDGDKIITTPCRVLADMGNELRLSHTRFAAWNDFLTELGETIHPAVDASPIPPGFFDKLPYNIVSRSGRESIEIYVTGDEWRNAELIELLYCPQGCHRGDGVCAAAGAERLYQ